MKNDLGGLARATITAFAKQDHERPRRVLSVTKATEADVLARIATNLSAGRISGATS